MSEEDVVALDRNPRGAPLLQRDLDSRHGEQPDAALFTADGRARDLCHDLALPARRGQDLTGPPGNAGVLVELDVASREDRGNGWMNWHVPSLVSAAGAADATSTLPLRGDR